MFGITEIEKGLSLTETKSLVEFMKDQRVQKFSGLGIEVEFYPDLDSLPKSAATEEELMYLNSDK